MKRFSSLLLLACISVGMSNCRKATDDLKFVYNADILKYTTSIQVRDVATGLAPQGAKLTVTGPDADQVYEVGGTKNFDVSNGTITLGLHPRLTPTEARNAKFDIIVTAPNYATSRLAVRMDGTEAVQSGTINMVNNTVLPTGAAKQTQSAPLTNGQTSTAVTVTTPSNPASSQPVSVSIPASTGFKDGSGAALSGTLAVNMTSFDISQPSALSAFPGNTFLVDDAQLPGGQVEDAIFETAGFTNLEMSVGNAAVKTFTGNPVNVTMTLRPGQINPKTGGAYAVNDSLEIWSYSTDDGIWKYERTGLVANQGGSLVVIFPTTHLTWFSMIFRRPACQGNSKGYINFTSNLAFRESFWLDVSTANTNAPVVRSIIEVKSGDRVTIPGISNANWRVRIYRNTPDRMNTPAAAPIYDQVWNPCGNNNLNVTLATSATPVSFRLGVTCPGTKGRIAKAPPIDVYCKYSSQPESAYFKLGTVGSNFNSTSYDYFEYQTTNLNNTSQYDFKTTLGGKTYYRTGRTLASLPRDIVRTIPVDSSDLMANYCP